jgi:hypothetical protein
MQDLKVSIRIDKYIYNQMMNYKFHIIPRVKKVYECNNGNINAYVSNGDESMHTFYDLSISMINGSTSRDLQKTSYNVIRIEKSTLIRVFDDRIKKGWWETGENICKLSNSGKNLSIYIQDSGMVKLAKLDSITSLKCTFSTIISREFTEDLNCPLRGNISNISYIIRTNEVRRLEMSDLDKGDSYSHVLTKLQPIK